MARTSHFIPPSRLTVLENIRGGARTVNALAASLGVTDNAVRLHLAALERDGHVRQVGVVKSGVPGQPAAEYELTSQGELALSRAYPPVLAALVGALGDRLNPRTTRAIFTEAGNRLAVAQPSHATGTLSARAHACAELIEALGGHVSVEVSQRQAKLTGAGCPLAAAVREEPATCTIIERLLARHAGVRVRQTCDHGNEPRCGFELKGR